MTTHIWSTNRCPVAKHSSPSGPGRILLEVPSALVPKNLTATRPLLFSPFQQALANEFTASTRLAPAVERGPRLKVPPNNYGEAINCPIRRV